MQLSRVACKSRACTRQMIKRTSRRRQPSWRVPPDSLVDLNERCPRAWGQQPHCQQRARVVGLTQARLFFAEAKMSHSTSARGSKSVETETTSLGNSARTAEESRRVQIILGAYAQSNAHSGLPSLNHLSKYSDDFRSSNMMFEPEAEADGGEGRDATTSEEISAEPSERASATDVAAGGGNARPVRRKWTFDEKGLARVTGENECSEEEHAKEKMLSKLLIGLHRRVLWKKMIFSKTTPMSPESRDIYAKQPGLDALDYFRRIRELGTYPPSQLCSLLVQLLASEGLLEEADETFVDVLDHGVLPSEACATMMIRLRVQRGKIDGAMEILAMMEGRAYRGKFRRPRFRSYQPVIRELFRRGDMEGVMKLWKHMAWHKILPKESFLLDLIADLATYKCPEESARDALTRLADQLLDGVSQTLIYPSAPTVKALLEGWGASWTDVSEQGTCMACGQKLEKVGLRGEDRMKVRSSIVQIAARNGAAEVQRLSWFANWFTSLEEPPTAIIDGPNAAYMDQNHEHGGFMLQQVDWLAEHLRSMGERVLIVMPWFYCRPERTPTRKGRQPCRKRQWTDQESGIIQEWLDKDCLVMVEGLDDLYWMYSTVAREDVNTVVVTNDLMRDHRQFFPGTREFLRWKRSHMVTFSFAWGEHGPLAWAEGKIPEGATPPTIKLVSGASWDEVQRTGDNWHLPVRISGTKTRGSAMDARGPSDASTAKSWLCVPVPTSLAAGEEAQGRSAALEMMLRPVEVDDGPTEDAILPR